MNFGRRKVQSTKAVQLGQASRRWQLCKVLTHQRTYALNSVLGMQL